MMLNTDILNVWKKDGSCSAGVLVVYVFNLFGRDMNNDCWLPEIVMYTK